MAVATNPTTDQEFAMFAMTNATTLAEACRQAEALGQAMPGCTGGTFKVLVRCPLGSVLGSREVEIGLVAGLAVVR